MNFVACEKNSLAVDFIVVWKPCFVNFIEVCIPRFVDFIEV